MPIHEVHGFPVSTPNLNITRSKITLDSGATYIDLVDAIATAEESGALTLHTARTDNPHSVTKSQIGLGNADNTSDAAKPISTATQAALDVLSESLGIIGDAAGTRVDDYDAVGDGVADDTAEIEAAIAAAGEYGKVVFTPGKTYLVDPTYDPTYQTYGGIKPLTGQVWEMWGAKIKAKTVVQSVYSVINLSLVDDVMFLGGEVYGERLTHVDTGGEWGHGIAIFASNRINLLGTKIFDCWGDCIYVGYDSTNAGNYSTEVTLVNVRQSNGRRQGISIVAGKTIKILGGYITDISGTGPGAGIDCEPNSSSYPNEDILIDGVTMRDCTMGLAVSVGNNNVRMVNSDMRGITDFTVLLGDNTRRLWIEGNRMSAAANAGQAGFVFTGATASTVDEVYIRRNVFDGNEPGGDFLLDLAAAGFKNVHVTDNDFLVQTANKRAVRFFGGTGCSFKRNRVRYDGATAGIASNYFIQLQNLVSGGNTYSSASSNAMYSNISTAVTHEENDHYIDSTLTYGALGGATGRNIGLNFTGSATYDPASLADGAGATTTVTCTGAALGDYAMASFSLTTSGITITAWVSAANTVSVRFQNESGGTLDIGSGTLRVRVTKA